MRPTTLCSFLLAGLAASTLAAPASAQGIQVTVRSMTSRTRVQLVDFATQMATPINFAECESATIGFRFSMVDRNRTQLAFFFGSMCEQASVRNDVTNTSCTDLELSYAIDLRTQVDVDIPVSSLLDCTQGMSGVRTIYVLALNDPTSEVGAAGQNASFPMAFDFQGPTEPSGFTARNGQSGTSVSWQATTDRVQRYDAFLVPGGCDASGNLTTDAFDDPDNPTVSPYTTFEGTATSGTISFPSGSAEGSTFAVTVRAIDNAGNTGTVAEPVCVTLITIDTFWSAYCGTADAPEACSSSCAAGPARSGAPAPWALLALAAALGLTRRRRSR
ncbi:MAG: hypothetical protein KF729_23555 [Sandaracinaceae bacterium]|nr:hypothetical protein [Sandaracinaceae bacterium]